jgi:hypothetical protein
MDDTHIVGFTSHVVPTFLQLQEGFLVLGLSVQPTKCVTLQGLDHSISLLLGFFIPNSSSRIFGVEVRSTSFIESFMVEAFHEDFKMIFNLPMLANPHVVFMMFCRATSNARATCSV